MSMYDKTNPDHQAYKAYHVAARKAGEAAALRQAQRLRGESMPLELWPDSLEQVHQRGLLELQVQELKRRMARIMRMAGK